jgi:hypothetical protein
MDAVSCRHIDRQTFSLGGRATVWQFAATRLTHSVAVAPALPIYPMRPASRAPCCSYSFSARHRASLMGGSVAHPRSIKNMATSTVNRKLTKYHTTPASRRKHPAEGLPGMSRSENSGTGPQKPSFTRLPVRLVHALQARLGRRATFQFTLPTNEGAIL